MDLLLTLLTGLPPLGALLYFLYARRGLQRGPLPASAFAGQPTSSLVWVPGVVQPRTLASLLSWRIHYPLPDGSSAVLAAAFTRPQTLRVGQVVPVKVDLATRRAVLDHPPHRNLVRFVLWTVGGVLLLGAVVAATIVASLA